MHTENLYLHGLLSLLRGIILITCKISKSIDLRYSTEIFFLYQDSEISESR